MDLGRMDGPVLVFGGPYSNLEATEAVLAEAERRGIPASRTICTGDVVAYCADPQATVDRIRHSGIAVVTGNCEESFGNDSDDCACGYEPGSACDLLSVQWYAHGNAHLDADARRWMRDTARRVTFEMAGRRLAVVHGAPSSINRILFESAADATLAAEIDLTGADGVICGHSGLPFTRVIDGRLWLNAGVIGMPANDGTPRVWYGLLRPEDDGISVELHPLAYDHETTAAKMRRHGLPEGYSDALSSGLYPSLDMLTEAEKARIGIPIASSSVSWPAPVAVS